MPPSRLWDTLYPGVGYRDVLETLAGKIFGMTTGREIEQVVRGPMCCTGADNLDALTCWAARPPEAQRYWVDTTSVPFATCRALW